MPTFPTWPGELPRSLDPLNWRHYFLLLFWIFFRPTALKAYLYQADPIYFTTGIHAPDSDKPGMAAIYNLVIISFLSTYFLPVLLSVLFSLIWSQEASFSTIAEVARRAFTGADFGRGIFMWVGIAYWAINEISGVYIGVVLVVSAGFAFGLANSVANGFARGVVFGLSSGVAGSVVFGVGIEITLGVALWLGFCLSIGYEGAFGWLMGVLRIPIAVIKCGSLIRLPLGSLYPLWWDELGVVIFPKGDNAIRQFWEQGEKIGLIKLQQLACNVFHRPIIRRALVGKFTEPTTSLHFLYHLFESEAMDSCCSFPFQEPDWSVIPTVRQVFIAELVGRGDELAQGIDKQLRRISQRLENFEETPPIALARLLYDCRWHADAMGSIPDSFNMWRKSIPFDLLSDYDGGIEIQQSFCCLIAFLSVSSLAEIANVSALLSELPPVEGSIRPPVIVALLKLGQIVQDVSVSEVATSRINSMAALARATESINGLSRFLDDGFWPPEKAALQLVAKRWLDLISERSGRIGQIVMARPVINPYVAGIPVRGLLFVGRDAILSQLEELWLKPGPVESVVLYGHRRMGKSSILQNLHHRLDPSTNWVVDFNLQTINRSQTGSLLFDLASKMHDELLRHPEVQSPLGTSAGLTVPEEGDFRANYQRAFSQWLDLLTPVMAGRRFIIAIDEYELLEEAMAEGNLDAQLSRYLRGVIQSQEWFVLALAGLYALQEQCYDYWHPLFASIKPRKVSFLSHAATSRLLTQPSDDFPLDYTSDTLDAIYALTHGQPYLVQLIGHNLVAQYNRRVLDGEREPDQPLSQNDLEAVIASPDFYTDCLAYFRGVWALAQDSPPGQHAILYVLAAGPASIARMALDLAFPIEQIKAALTTLEAHDVITHDADGVYTFTVELMRRWLTQRLAIEKSNPEDGLL